VSALAVPARFAMLTENVRVIEYEPDTGEGIRISAQVTVDPGNPVFPGHFPGLPVFPGVCQIDCVHRTVLVAAQIEGAAPVLVAASAARFLRMVAPRDEIRINTLIARTCGEWKVTGDLRRQSDPVARVTLRYRPSQGGTP
jgi:3-hydroxyacyl-[acyl-carrier-protein] dehydratase